MGVLCRFLFITRTKEKGYYYHFFFSLSSSFESHAHTPNLSPAFTHTHTHVNTHTHNLPFQGTDALGDFTAQSFEWTKSKGGTTLMTTTFRTYASDEGMIVFEQSFPADLETGTSDE